MFEHLDDPSAGEPTARQIAAVYARSSAVRRRRANTRFAALGVLLLIIGLLGGTLIPRSQTHLAVTNLALDDHELVAGLQVPAIHLINLVFPDAQHGFAVTTGTRKVALVATSDAGKTWTVVNPDLPISSPWALQLDFTDLLHGYLWLSAGSMWVTHDGGRSWSKAPLGPQVFDVSAIGSNVWALTTCGPISAVPGVGCGDSASYEAITLHTSTDQGRTWAVVSQVQTTPDAASANDTVELARMTSMHAYVLSLSMLAYTADGGKTWATRSDPCVSSAFSDSSQLAGSGTDDLWLLCLGQPWEGQQPKALYRSFDGGMTWTLASSAVAGTPGTEVAQTGTLPESGEILNLTGVTGPLLHGDIAVVSATRAWLFLGDGSVIQTTDGGHTWSDARLPGFAPDGFGSVVFATPTRGWVDSPAGGIWRTTNAHTWEQLGT